MDDAISLMVSRKGRRSFISSGTRASTLRSVIALKFDDYWKELLASPGMFWHWNHRNG